MKQTTREKWRERVRKWKASGLTAKEFAAESPVREPNRPASISSARPAWSGAIVFTFRTVIKWLHVLADERDGFLDSLSRHRVEAEKEVREESGAEVGLREAALAERIAVARALVDNGILEIRRSRISSPIKFKNCSRIMR